jgi:hypothetical protein
LEERRFRSDDPKFDAISRRSWQRQIASRHDVESLTGDGTIFVAGDVTRATLQSFGVTSEKSLSVLFF